ncbi:MAG TPA: hypothetical protein VHL30_02780, partial [Chlamydiales bacterium]|nr:hypothetical protein [Chlamydiales bacterium]
MSTLTPVSAESQKPSTTESVSTLATAGKILGVTLLSSGAAGGIVYALGGSPDLVAIVAAGVFIGLGLLAFCVSEYLKSRQFEVVNGESALSLEEAQKAVTKLYSPKPEFALFSMGDDQNKFAESDSTDLETDSAPVDGNKSDQEGLARQAVRTLHCGKFNPFLSGLQFTQLQQHEEPLVQIQAQIIQRQQQALETLQAIQSSGQVTQEQVDLVEKFNADIPALNSKRQGHRAAIDMTKSTVASGGMTPLDDLKECQEQAAQIQALDKEIERLGQETTRILKQRALEEAGVVLVDLGDPDESDVSIDDFLVIGRSPVKPQDSMEDFEDLGDVEP